ncbi:MAG: MBL fold metallo-hydrolase [Actinomycetota bacterium]|nr:MBL fold metallo-hydrolase [Actinomycetota bacterium]
MPDALTILGGGGWFPAHGRQTACALLRRGEHAVLIDAGTGVGRLVETPSLLDGIRRLDIVLTHFHLDHVAGLAYLPAALRACEQKTVWGPGQLLYSTSTRALLDAVSHEPFHPIPLEDQAIDVRDLPDQEIDFSGMRMAVRRQDRHSVPTLGLRFDDELAWITDTAYDADSAAFARGCRVLAHEAWYTTAHPRHPEIHSSAAQAAHVAGQAGIDRLLLMHLPPFELELCDLLAEARLEVPNAIAADDYRDLSALLTPNGAAAAI